jgi:hypothetical protein
MSSIVHPRPSASPNSAGPSVLLVFYMYHPGRGVGSKYSGSHVTTAYLWYLGLIWVRFGTVVSSSRACTMRWFAGLYVVLLYWMVGSLERRILHVDLAASG